MEQNKKSPLPIIIAIIFLLVAGVSLAFYFISQENPEEENADDDNNTALDVTPSPTVVSVNETPSSAQTTGKYADGSYTVDASYSSPGGFEGMDVSITLEDDIIKSVSIVIDPDNDDESDEYTSLFKNRISGEVVGKNIDDADVSRLSGASLTSRAFNNALDDIKTEAEV